MLLSLSIRDIVLVESLDIPFGSGFCVLTGETGAGKSILLDALSLALGKRAESRLVRSGKNFGSVTAEFSISPDSEINNILAEQAVGTDGNLFLRRVVYADGKSKAFINDCPVGQNLLQNLADMLIEVHGQHDQRGLLSSSTHGLVLDEYAGLVKELDKIKSVYANWRKAESELNKTRQKEEKARKEEDYLRHVKDELEKLAPVAGEEEKLAEQRSVMMNREKIIEALNSSMAEISGNIDVASAIRSASRILERNSEKSGDIFTPAIEALDRAATELSEATAKIEEIGSNIDMDDNSLDKLEERLFALRAAARKHNRTVDDLPAYLEEVEKQIGLIESQEELLAELEKQVIEAKKDYSKIAMLISEKRQKFATKLEDALKKELTPLKMANASLKVEIENLAEEKWSEKGWDKISFMVSTNPGSPYGPLGKIASGGELSRFMLALKVVLSGNKSLPTLIFDEIDTGIGGAVADAVGRRLKELSELAQVLCVTHQPQVASLSDFHLRVDKKTKNGEVKTFVEKLSDKARSEEIARMLSGATISDEARAAAVKLMGT